MFSYEEVECSTYNLDKKSPGITSMPGLFCVIVRTQNGLTPFCGKTGNSHHNAVPVSKKFRVIVKITCFIIVLDYNVGSNGLNDSKRRWL